MTKIPDLKAHVEVAAKVSRSIFNATGQILPMIHAIDAKGEHYIIQLMHPENDQDKDAMAVAMRHMLTKKDIVQYVLICEAWTVRLNKDAIKPGDPIPRPSTHPDRVEVITFQGETKDAHHIAQIIITRDKSGKGLLGDLETIDSDSSTGRWAGLLKPMTTSDPRVGSEPRN